MEDMKDMKIVVASRGSRLAVAQAGELMEPLRKRGAAVELMTIKTTGDRITDRPLDKLGGKGLFTRELEEALRSGAADMAVHSCKDVPMELPEDLPIAAFSRREDPRDVLILPEGVKELDRGRPIGCGSQRRRVQLEALYPGVAVEPVRGNVTTRLRKLDGGAYGALVLAAAGVKRLGLEGRVSRYFSVDELLPAAGQGILAVQCRRGMDAACLDGFRNHAGTVCALAERAFVRTLGGGCSSPAAAYAELSAGTVVLRGLYVDGSGNLRRGRTSGPWEEGQKIARELALELKGGI